MPNAARSFQLAEKSNEFISLSRLDSTNPPQNCCHGVQMQLFSAVMKNTFLIKHRSDALRAVGRYLDVAQLDVGTVAPQCVALGKDLLADAAVGRKPVEDDK